MNDGSERSNQANLNEPPLPICQTIAWPVNLPTAPSKPDEELRISIGLKRRDISPSNLNRYDDESCRQQKKPKTSNETTSKITTGMDIDPTGLSDFGSPRDPAPRQPIHVEDLDLHRSYVDNYIVIPSIEDGACIRQTRWRHAGPEPLTDPAKLPEGWNTNEPDLDKR